MSWASYPHSYQSQHYHLGASSYAHAFAPAHYPSSPFSPSSFAHSHYTSPVFDSLTSPFSLHHHHFDFGADVFAAKQLPPQPQQPQQSPPQAGAPPAADGHSHYYRGADEWCGHTFNTLGYWRVRGLAAPIRMMLAYQNVPYENKFYDLTQREDGTWDRSEWLEHKEGILKHNNPLINLPYLESVDDEGGIVLAQSNAILNHLGRRFNLTGCTEIDAAKADMLMGQLVDVRQGLSRLFYQTKDDQDFNQQTAEYFAEGGSFATQFQKFEDWFNAQQAKFLVEEDHPIMADFVFWELCDVHNELQPGCLDAFPAVSAFYNVFRNLRELQDYFNSDLYKLPINGKVARWGTEGKN